MKPKTYKICSIVDCGRFAKARGYCSLHWQRWRHGLDMTLPRRYHQLSPKGWIVGGYRFICTPDKREMPEHRYIMEQAIGRRLETDEIVHHKNGDKLDNRLANLEIMPRDSHTSHHRNHRKKCVICQEDTGKAAYGLCAKHFMQAKRFYEGKVGEKLPQSKPVKAFLVMGIALAQNNTYVAEALESLYGEN